MAEIEDKNHRFTLPGEKLGVIEEFISGPGAYERNGTLYSTLLGYALIDRNDKTVRVKPITETPIVPKEGDEVVGMVVHVQDKLAIIELFVIGDTFLHIPFSAALRIADSSHRYERVMNDIYKRGDIVRAKIINDKNRIPLLTTADQRFGTIEAFCSRCGEELNIRGRMLLCSVCNNRESRKIAQDYGKSIVGGILGGKNNKGR